MTEQQPLNGGKLDAANPHFLHHSDHPGMSYLDKLWQSFWKLKFMKNQALELHSPLPKSFKVCKKGTMEKRKIEDSSCSFFGTFGALPEVHFLHSIYHFKAQEVKNPTLQTVYNLELK
ncbi:hypothetical protein CK203_055488 [Vitis vinifera]|uniref:Uncharacterized protein n=1 Tax=Vitis vinifera TaxID=29760 RepID=A0A438FKS7_VITVI|nr:hypothetical protein CK203_055488 [Vitis vinifera]